MLEKQITHRIFWLRSIPFDMTLIVGCFLLAIFGGFLSYYKLELYEPILLWNIWLLGYHHVIATYTRFFDREDRSQHQWSITWLPFAVGGTVIVIGIRVGVWALASIYLYWQFFHYARQSHGIAQAYRRKGKENVLAAPMKLHHALIYVVPVYGILYRSTQQPNEFLSMPVKVIPYSIAAPLTAITGFASIIAVVWYGIYVYKAIQKNEFLNLGYHLFLITHLIIFLIGYVYIDDISCGWLVLNIWHNAQYILFVWHFNCGRYRNKPTTKVNNRIVSWLVHRSPALYFLATMFVTVVFYLFVVNSATAAITSSLNLEPILIVMITYQTINFHHYIVDGVIWKMRRKNLQNALNL